MSNWYVFYTKSRQEKKVADYFLSKGENVFLPTHVVVRQWSDRRKKIEVPLFNSYIFFNIEPHDIVRILQHPGIAWNIRHNEAPAVVPDAEITTIKRFMATGMHIEIQPTENLVPGELVEIHAGPLKGTKGIYLQSENESRLSVSLESIGLSMVVQVDRTIVSRTNLP